MDLYENAHLVVAAVRVLEHRHDNAPSIEDICRELSFSAERGNLIVRKLAELGILDVTQGAYGSRVFLRDHLAIEQIPRGGQEDVLAEELEKFKSARKEHSKKIEAMQAEQAAKKKSLFDEIEKKLKKDLEKRKSGKK